MEHKPGTPANSQDSKPEGGSSAPAPARPEPILNVPAARPSRNPASGKVAKEKHVRVTNKSSTVIELETANGTIRIRPKLTVEVPESGLKSKKLLLDNGRLVVSL